MKFRSFYRIFFFKNSAKHLGQALGLLIGISATTVNAQAGIENIAQMRQQIVHFLTEEYRQLNADKVDIKMAALDSRLRLTKCDQPLTLRLQDAIGNGGNITVQVSCKGSSNWTILAPAQAIVFRSMAVAGRTLQRGELITDADIVQESMDVSQYRQGFSIKPEDIIGKEVKYPINKGEVFRTSALNAPMTVRRGDEVSLESFAGSIRVVTTGTAISDGRLGQQIRVKNNQSARIVNAKVVGPGKVQTML